MYTLGDTLNHQETFLSIIKGGFLILLPTLKVCFVQAP